MLKIRMMRVFTAFVALGVFTVSRNAMAIDDPTISNVFLDFDSTPQMIHILGGNFTAPSMVALGTLELTVTEATTDVLSAELPALADGDYLLTVTAAKDSGKDARSVTYGLTYSTPQPISQPTYAIGDTGPAGGFVFYVTTDGLHGLEAAPADQGAVAWGCRGADIPGAQGTAIGTGRSNTEAILQGCETGIAAALAASYVSPTGYFDWYLPSKDELNLMYQNLHLAGLGGFVHDPNDAGFYWSSSEADVSRAWGQYFSDGLDGLQGAGLEDHNALVRAARAF